MTLSEIYFQVNEIDMLWHTNIWAISFVILSIPVNYTVMRWKFSSILYLSSFLNALGAWIRYIAYKRFIIGLLGTLITSIA